MNDKIWPASFAVVMIAVIGTGFYIMGGFDHFTSDQSANPDPQIEKIKTTDSYKQLSSSETTEITKYEVGQEEIKFARETEHPYNFSNNSGMSSLKATLELVTEFGNFSLTESTILVANHSSDAYIYQMKEDRIINERNGRVFYDNLMDARVEERRREDEAERKEMCSEVSLRIYNEMMEEDYGEEASYSMPKIGVWNVANRSYDGTTEMIIYENDGEKHVERRYGGFPAGGGYNFEFEDISSIETVKNITLNPEECPEQRTTVTDFS